jgi:hypothetical protein
MHIWLFTPHLTKFCQPNFGIPICGSQLGDEVFQGARFRYCGTLLQGIIVGPRRMVLRDVIAGRY